MTTDDVFLAEVEDFLTSIDLPTFPPAQALDEDVDSDPPTERVAVATLDAQYTRKTPPKHSDELKYELERAKDRKRRSAYRERRRIERETLQQQVRELSKQLSDLENGEDIGRQLSKSAWKMIAERQYQARASAEAYQRQLIAAIDAHSALFKDFQEFAGDKLTDDTEEAEELYRPKRIKLEPSDAEFCKIYLQELDTIYAQSDEVLRTCGLEPIDVNWDTETSNPTWKEEGDSDYFICVDKYAVPFSIEQAMKSLWRLAQLPHRQEDRQPFGQVDNPENTSAYKFRVTTRLHSGRVASIRQRVVTRRYTENGRGVIVWRSFTEGEGMFTGMHSDETGRVVIIPLPGKPEEGILARTCIRHKPMHFNCVATENSTAKQFTGAVIDTELFDDGGGEDSADIVQTQEPTFGTYATHSRDEYESLRAHDRKKRSVYRARKRAERDNLRVQVAELSAELEKRQKVADNNSLPSAWKMIAQLRLQERLRAEEQQRRLSEAVDARATLIMNFKNLCSNESLV